MKSYTGKSGKTYHLEDVPLGQGGEGAVYALSNDPDHVAKLYHPHKKFTTEAARQELLEKIETMYSMKIKAKIDGILRVAWVEDILFDNGVFVGYAMPRVSVPYKIFEVTRDDRVTIFPKYTWKYSVQYAYNLSWVVWYLHMNDIIIGDMNMNNIAVGTKGEVVLIDCDSFDIRDPQTGEHFPCRFCIQDLIAPEVQRYHYLEKASFTKESDNFALAIHIFRLLMNNEDPFGGAITQNVSSRLYVPEYAIIHSECAYVREVPEKRLARMPKLDILPPSIQMLFQRSFNYTHATVMKSVECGPTAKEWMYALAEIASAEPTPKLTRCIRNPKHVYPVHNFSCPWCSLAEAAYQQVSASPPIKIP